MTLLLLLLQRDTEARSGRLGTSGVDREWTERQVKGAKVRERERRRDSENDEMERQTEREGYSESLTRHSTAQQITAIYFVYFYLNLHWLCVPIFKVFFIVTLLRNYLLN